MTRFFLGNPQILSSSHIQSQQVNPVDQDVLFDRLFKGTSFYPETQVNKLNVSCTS